MTAKKLQVDDVSCHFDGVIAVADLSFTVAAGEIKAIIGPNGAGKSTLFNIIAGVTKPDNGRVLFDARTFQNLQIFREMSVLENVMAGRHMRGGVGPMRALLGGPSVRTEEDAIATTAMSLLSRFQLAERAEAQAGTLSFGEQKLLELARALACEPSLLLLDEPAAGLPHAEADRLGEIISDLNRAGMTVLLVEHNMRMVMSLAHDVLVLNNGRRIAEGPAEEVRRDPDVLAAYLGESADA
jgi:branched-chain amino acid transport system ATP-binding protein